MSTRSTIATKLLLKQTNITAIEFFLSTPINPNYYWFIHICYFVATLIVHPSHSQVFISFPELMAVINFLSKL